MATAKQFVDTAAAEVGNGPSKYNAGGQPWCAIFVNWCLKKCGDSRQRTATACSFADMGSLHKSSDGYEPKPGDLILINLKSDRSWAEHVAIVKAYSNGRIAAINGNGGGNKVTDSTRPYDSSVTVVEMSWDNDGSSGGSSKADLPKIFLNPGHGKYPNGTYDPGAVGNGYKEAELTREVVRIVEGNLSGYAEVTVFDYEKDLYKYLGSTEFKWSEYDYFLSIHFDAGGGNGTTVYRAKNRTASEVENKLAAAVSEAGGFKNNGVKEHPSNLAVLSAADKAQNGGTTATLLEVCFIDSSSDMQRYSNGKEAVAKAISDALIQGLNLTYCGGGRWDAPWKEMKLPNNARALKSKTYERYWKIKNQSTINYKVSCGDNASTHSTKLRVYKNSFLIVALGSYYGPCGTYVKISFDDGTELICIKGDEKDDRETNTDEPPHSYHTDGPGVVEANSISCNLLEVQADVEGSDWQSGFKEALNTYTGRNTYDASITGIWVSDTEPVYKNGGTASEANFYNTNEVLPIHPTVFNLSDMMPSEDIAVYVGQHNITAACGALSWTNTLQELSTAFTFTSAKSDTRFQTLYTPQKGDILRVYINKSEVFRGVILSDDTGNRHSNSYTAADVGRYLNQTTDTYQFKGMPAVQALEKILSDLSIPVAYMDADTLDGTFITEIYIDKKISEVIWDILSKVGGIWNYDMVPTGIRIYKAGAFVSEPKFRVAANTAYKSSVKYRGAESVSSSIEDMKTSVKVISDTNVLAAARNEDAYGKYGFLQEVIKLENEDDNPSDLAQSKLWELCREKQTRSFPMVVELSDYTRAGDILYVDEVSYLITSAQHEIKNGRHSLTVDLERIELS